jgi:hypothetical protein
VEVVANRGFNDCLQDDCCIISFIFLPEIPDTINGRDDDVVVDVVTQAIEGSEK